MPKFIIRDRSPEIKILKYERKNKKLLSLQLASVLFSLIGVLSVNRSVYAYTNTTPNTNITRNNVENNIEYNIESTMEKNLGSESLPSLGEQVLTELSNKYTVTKNTVIVFHQALLKGKCAHASFVDMELQGNGWEGVYVQWTNGVVTISDTYNNYLREKLQKLGNELVDLIKKDPGNYCN